MNICFRNIKKFSLSLDGELLDITISKTPPHKEGGKIKNERKVPFGELDQYFNKKENKIDPTFTKYVNQKPEFARICFNCPCRANCDSRDTLGEHCPFN